MGLPSSISKTLKNVVGSTKSRVGHTEDTTQERSRCTGSTRCRYSRNRRNSIQRLIHSRSAGAIGRNTEIISQARSIGRAQSPPGSARIHESRQADTPTHPGGDISSSPVRRHRGRIRPLQESSNNKVDPINPPPVPTMPPSVVNVLQNAIWGKRKDGKPLIKEELERHEMFQELKEEVQPQEKEKTGRDKEEKNRRKSMKRLDGWQLDREILRQRNKIEDAEFEAENKAAAVKRERKRLEILERRAGGSPGASPRGAQTPKADNAISEGSNNLPVDNVQSLASSSEDTSSQLRPEVQRSSTAPSRLERPTAKSSTIQQSLPDREVSRASQSRQSALVSNSHEGAQYSQESQQAQPRRPEQGGGARELGGGSEAQRAQSGGRSNASRLQSSSSQSSQDNSTKEQASKSGQQRSRSHRASSTPKKPVPPSPLRQNTTTKEVESCKEPQRAQPKKKPSTPGQQKPESRQQPSSKAKSANKNEQQTFESAEKSSPSKTPVPSRPTQSTRPAMPSLTEDNVATIKGVESEAAFVPETEFGRGVGDMARTYLEGMVPMTSSDMAEDREKVKSDKRRQQEAEEMEAQKNINKTELNRQLGNMKRTYVEGLMRMTGSEKAKETESPKSEMRRRREASELAAQQSMANKTVLNREVGNMQRTNVEGMVTKTGSDIVREKGMEKSGMRRQQEESELAAQKSMANKTVLHREVGNMMRTNVEGLATMTASDYAKDEKEAKSRQRKEQEAAEQGEQEKLAKITQYNRQPGDMQRTYLEGMVSMDQEEVKEEKRKQDGEAKRQRR